MIGPDPPQRLTVLLALVSAAAAVAGAVIGGLVGYLGTKELGEERSERAAVGAARVYQEELDQAARKLTITFESKHLSKAGTSFTPYLAKADRQLIASALSSEQWGNVVAAEAALREFQRLPWVRTLADRGVDIRSDYCDSLSAEYLEPLKLGVASLSDLANFRPEEYWLPHCHPYEHFPDEG